MKLQINLGPAGISPSGTGRTELPKIEAGLGTITKCEVGASHKQGSKAVGLRVNINHADPVKVGDEQAGGLGVEAWLSLPEGNDFSQDTKAGKANRARVAEIKSFFVALGAISPEQATAAGGDALNAVDTDQLVNMTVRYKYEPSNEHSEYPAWTWLAPTAFDEVRAGTRKVADRNVAKKGAGAGLPIGGASTGAVQGLLGGLGGGLGGGMQMAQPQTAQPAAGGFSTGTPPVTPSNGGGAASAAAKLLGIG